MLFRKIDCVRLPVSDLDEAIAFYGRLGHEVIWRRSASAGLRLPETDAELVLMTDRGEAEIDMLVEDADAAAQAFAAAGGRIAEEPFDIEIGRCAAVEDGDGNRLVLLDMRYGPIA